MALVLRLAAILVSPNTQDIPNYHLVGETLLQGGRLYADTPTAYPYPPLWAMWEVAAVLLGRWVPYPLVVRLPILAAEIGILVMLRNMAGPRAALLYAITPLPIMISGFHGQFDSLPLLFILAARARHWQRLRLS